MAAITKVSTVFCSNNKPFRFCTMEINNRDSSRLRVLLLPELQTRLREMKSF